MDTILTTKEIIARVISDVLEKVGLCPDYAETIAQHEAATSARIGLWSDWLAANCLECSHTPVDCDYFSPSKESCKGISPEDIKNGNMIAVERGLSRCPLFTSVDP